MIIVTRKTQQTRKRRKGKTLGNSKIWWEFVGNLGGIFHGNIPATSRISH
ncbi:MAG: hypothetical protein ACI90V_005615 [Bacillariaceae sp.]|jgi:hypothetical protein